MNRVYPNPKTECWEWKQSIGKHGYGQTFFQGKVSLAHRASYMLFNGEIPKGYQIDHLCKNRICVNPDHLEAVTQQENIRRQSNYQRGMTHCKRGHEFTPENTYKIPTTGSRQCKRCALEWQRIYQPKYRLEKKLGLR